MTRDLRLPLVLQLPGGLRNRIYDHLLVSDDMLHLDNLEMRRHKWTGLLTGLTPSLLRVCRQFQAGYVETLYGLDKLSPRLRQCQAAVTRCCRLGYMTWTCHPLLPSLQGRRKGCLCLYLSAPASVFIAYSTACI